MRSAGPSRVVNGASTPGHAVNHHTDGLGPLYPSGYSKTAWEIWSHQRALRVGSYDPAHHSQYRKYSLQGWTRQAAISSIGGIGSCTDPDVARLHRFHPFDDFRVDTV